MPVLKVCQHCGSTFSVSPHRQAHAKYCSSCYHRARAKPGDRFGRLTILRRARERYYWVCRCECGTIRTHVYQANLIGGKTLSCGCLRNERIRAVELIHGHSRRGPDGRQITTPEYRAWRSAKRRCFDPHYPRYRDWGGRGITMCAEWRDDFLAFYAHIGPKPPNTILDRIDNDGPYAPGNVRWTSFLISGRNRRRVKAHV